MDKKQLADIGQRLRRKRNDLGLTREQMAELADIGVGFYGQLEVGTSQMSIDTLIKLSRSMHVSMDYIILGEDDEEKDSDAVIELLKNSSSRELKLAEQVLKLFLMKV